MAADLRRRIDVGEWTAGQRLPSEHMLMESYEVSRATVRTALQTLEGLGFTASRQGSGTFVLEQANNLGAIDLRRLESLSETLRRHDYEPTMEYRSAEIAHPSAETSQQLGLNDGELVLSAARALSADAQIVAFSYFSIPLRVLGPGFSKKDLSGSIFGLLKEHGLDVVVAHTGIHVASGPDIGWGDVDDSTMYLLLDEVQIDHRGQRVLHSKTYFIEGRFNFSVTRTR